MSDFGPIANHLWQSTAFASVAALLALALRHNHARERYWLWMAASLKFLAPFSLLMAFGSRLSWHSSPLAVREVISSAMDDFAAPFGGPAVAVNHSADTKAAIPVGAVLIALWAIGCAAVLIRWAMRWRRVAAIVAAADRLVKGREVEALLRAQSAARHHGRVRLVLSPAQFEPAVFGIFRPVLLIPRGIAQLLSDRELEAIFAHELCHLRRRDNLAAAIHMLVEAIFWFYPLVWWLSARLVEERERACDEEALRLGADRKVYAQSILRACAFYLQAPAPCMSGVTGGGLESRIERIMKRPLARTLGRRGKLLLASVAAAVAAAPVFIGIGNVPVARAQSETKSEAFEVVSVKPAKPGQRGRGFVTNAPGRMRMTNVTLSEIIQVAYGIQREQLAASLPQDHYEILGTAPSHPSQKLDERYQAMMRAMLAERFQLKVHRESKVLAVYALDVAKGGPKLKESEEPGLSTHSTPGHVTATGATLLDLATYLTRRVGRLVVDVTGLKGLYDFKLDWEPGEGDSFVEPPDPTAPRTAEAAQAPSLLTAIQEQLGLKLESRKLPVEMLVVDHWEKPSEN